jgi:hypothetical protein
VIAPAADPVSGWDIATAIGTIAAALATAGAIVAALLIARSDRREAARANREQIAAAREAQDRQLEAARDARVREHEVDLLLRLIDLIAKHRMRSPGSAEREEIELKAFGILLSLPGGTADLAAVRALFFPWRQFDGVPSYEDRYGKRPGDQNSLRTRSHTELSDRIQRVMSDDPDTP